jgi:hypothetical protein
MRRPAPAPALLTGQPFTLAMARQQGVSRRRLDSSLWRSLGRDLWVSAETPDSADLFIAATTLVLPTAAVSGAAAAWLHGVDVLPPSPEPIDVVIDRTWRPGHRHLVTAHRAPLPAEDVTVIRGVRCTTPLRTAYDLARGSDLREAVVAVDALLHARLITVESLAEFAAQRGWPDGARVSRVLELADAGAESPQESRLRLILVLDAGLPKPTTQFEVWTEDGVFVARLDLAYLLPRRLGIEYDGQLHAEEDRRLRDHQRHNRLLTAQWPVLYYGAKHVFHQRDLIVHEVRTQLAEAA